MVHSLSQPCLLSTIHPLLQSHKVLTPLSSKNDLRLTRNTHPQGQGDDWHCADHCLIREGTGQTTVGRGESTLRGSVQVAPLVDVDPHTADARPKGNILGNGHVPEQSVALKDKAYLSLLDRQLCRILVWPYTRISELRWACRDLKGTCWALG